MPKCLVVQHVPPEGPYTVGATLQAAGVALHLIKVFAGDVVPITADDYDGLVVMGGPMSAARDEGFPSRRAEIEVVRSALQNDIPILGVCLGAQILASAVGATVYPGPVGPEIGWAPIHFTPAGRADFLLGGLGAAIEVLHWHGDTFDLPPGADLLASSDKYRNQAFRIGDRAWGLQFHAEVDDAAVDAFVAAFGDEARAAGVDPEQIRKSAVGALDDLGASRDLIVSRFAGLVADRAAEDSRSPRSAEALA